MPLEAENVNQNEQKKAENEQADYYLVLAGLQTYGLQAVSINGERQASRRRGAPSGTERNQRRVG